MPNQQERPGQRCAGDPYLTGFDPANADIALLQIDGASRLPVASLGTSTAIKVGEDVIAVGYALDLQGPPSVSRGIVTAVDPISSGNCGGALVNADGEVIGITTFVASPGGSAIAENLNFAIPIAKAIAIVRQIRGTPAA